MASKIIYALADDIELSYTVPSTTAGDYIRTFNIAIKYNTAAFQAIAPRYTPIVIYSHGGSEGSVDGHKNLGQEWTDELFKNGFLTINIEHAPVISTDEQVAVCENVNLDNATETLTYDPLLPPPAENSALTGSVTLGGDCIYFHATQYLRYHDIEAVLDYLNNTLATDLPEVADQWNGKLALMGHSAGSGAVMHYAGATRTYLCPTNTYVEADPTKFDAYVALSPQSHTESPHFRGYAATIAAGNPQTVADPAAVTAWDNIDQPILNISGLGDTTGIGTPLVQAAEDRRIPFTYMPNTVGKGIKHELWFTSPNLEHVDLILENQHLASRDDPYEIMTRTTVRFLNKHTGRYPNIRLGAKFVNNIVPGYTDMEFRKK